MQGGYIMINISAPDVFEKLLITKDLGKPILLYIGNQSMFIDVISGGDVDTTDDEGNPLTYDDITLSIGLNQIVVHQDNSYEGDSLNFNDIAVKSDIPHLYAHNLQWSSINQTFFFTAYLNDDTPLTYQTIQSKLKNCRFVTYGYDFSNSLDITGIDITESLCTLQLSLHTIVNFSFNENALTDTVVQIF